MTFDATATLARLAARHGIAFRPELLPRSERLTREPEPTLHYLRWPGDGEPVLFLHGGALTAHTWDLVCLALAPSYACFSLDLRGHGESGWSETYRIEQHVEDVLALIATLGFPRLHLVGMSLGGNVAAHTAARLGERLRSLTLIDIAARVNRGGTAGMHRFLAGATSMPSVEALIDSAVAVSLRSDRDTVAYRYQYMTRQDGERWAFRQDRSNPPDYPHMVEKLAEIEQLAPGVGAPLLIVRGGRSRVLGDTDARDLAGRFAHGHVVTLDEAGHNVQEDCPRELADALRTHFARADAISARASAP